MTRGDWALKPPTWALTFLIALSMALLGGFLGDWRASVGLQDDILDLRGDVVMLRGDVAELRENVATGEEGRASLLRQVESLERSMERLGTRIDNLTQLLSESG